MRARARTAAHSTPMLGVWAAISLTSAIAIWFAAMAPRLIAQARFGPLCSAHGLRFVLHCPSCYVAIGLAGLGLTFAGVEATRMSRTR